MADWDDDEFEGAGTTSAIDLEECLGHTLLIRVVEVVESMETTHGEAVNVPRADVVDIDTGIEYEDVLLFGRVLSGQLRRKVGKQVVGTMGQGEKEKGKSPAWVLQPMTEEDKDKVMAWKKSRLTGAGSASGSTKKGGNPPF